MPNLPTELTTDWRSLESRWDWFFYAVLAALLLFLPFSLGAVEPWSKLVVVAASVVLAVSLSVRVFLDANFRVVRTWAYLPLLAIVGLIIFQLLPLPEALVGLFSAESIDLRERLLGDLAANSDSFPTISLYPYETAHDLRMAFVFIVVFVTVASVFQSQTQIKQALWGVFILGCLEAALAGLQILTLSQRVHWMFSERGSVVTSGSFINYSHFCQFMNLAIGAGVALVLVRMKSDSRRDRGQVSRFVDLRGERYLRPLTGIVLCVVVVFTSMSRNGVLSLLIASAVIAVALYRRGVLSVRGWLLAIVPWSVVLLVFLTSFDDIYERFATLAGQGSLSGRLEMTSGTLRAWRDFPLLGTGLGTHEYVFPLYDRATSPRMAEHADNDWAQLLEEFGLLGALAVISFVLSIFAIAGKLMLKGQTALSTAAFGLSIGLLAGAWHSLSDFGQHIPGVFILTAVVSGLVVAIARYERRKTRSKESASKNNGARPDWSRSRLFLVPASLLILLACWWVLAGAFRAHRAEAWANSALAMEQRIASEKWLGDDQDFVDLLAAAERAVELEPTNVKHSYLLNLYRWRSISRVSDPDSEAIRLDQNALPFVARIVEELARLRSLCPVYGPTFGLEGELRKFVLQDEAGGHLISEAAKLIPFHAGTNFVAGQLAASEARWDDAQRFFDRTVDLEPRQFRAVASAYVKDFDRADLAEGLAGDEYSRLIALAEILESAEPSSAENIAGAQKLRGRALQGLRELVRIGEASPGEIYTLARVELRNKQPQEAISLLRRALTLNYGQVRWRLILAQTLFAEGELEQSLREAKIALRLDPRLEAANKLVAEIENLKGG